MSSTNDMHDLKMLVQRKLRENIHGQEFDLLYQNIELPTMLGVDSADTRGTLLHPSHSFWEDYNDDIKTEREVNSEIQKAVKILFDEDTFRKRYPEGKDADIVYCEVDPVETGDEITVICNECEKPAIGTMLFEPNANSYELRLFVECGYCGEESWHERILHRA